MRHPLSAATGKSIVTKHPSIPPDTNVETWEKGTLLKPEKMSRVRSKKSQIFTSGLSEETILKALLVNLV
jgi:hypothetical protein